MGKIRKFMATRCEHCPLCRHARNNPDTVIGRVMEWHGKFCPFWKAWKEHYGDPSSRS